MDLYRFAPGLDGDPERIAPRFRDSGSKFEPGHRMLALAHFGGREVECRYNRDTRAFWIRFGPGDYMESGETPEAFEQMPPDPSPGLPADAVIRSERDLPPWLRLPNHLRRIHVKS